MLTSACADAIEGTPPDLPLVVDFDGTLSLADTLAWLRQRYDAGSARSRARRLGWLTQSKQREKINLWKYTRMGVDEIPIDPEVVLWLTGEFELGRPLILATGSAQELADAVGQRLGIFTATIGSDPGINLTGPRKAAVLVERFGKCGFDYVGDGPADIPVWNVARLGYLVKRSTTPDFEIPGHVQTLYFHRPMLDPAGHAYEGTVLADDGKES